MAAYSELYGLMSNSVLRNKIAVAVGVAAETIRLEDGSVPNHANRLIWAARAYSQPITVASECQWAVIITNRALDVATILAAGDAAIQNNVDDVVNMFATG